jgi:hypothetical protein
MLVVAGAIAAVLAATAATAVAVTHGDASLESLPPGVALLDAETGHLRAHISEKEIAQPVEVVAGAGNLWVWNSSHTRSSGSIPADGEHHGPRGIAVRGDAGWYLARGRRRLVRRAPGSRPRVNVDPGQEVDRFHLTDSEARFGVVAPSPVCRSLCCRQTTRRRPRSRQSETPSQGAIQRPSPGRSRAEKGGICVGSNRGPSPDRSATDTIVANGPIPRINNVS